MDKQDIKCVFSDDNSENLIMRIQLLVDSDDEVQDCEEDMICVLKNLENDTNDIILTELKTYPRSNWTQ